MNKPITPRELPPTKWFHYISLVGLNRCSALEASYFKELKNRYVEEFVWKNYEFDPEVKEFVCQLLAEKYWFANEITFHPEDSYFVVGGLQTGDLAEVEVLMDIEDEFSLNLPEDLELDKMTLIEFIQYLSKNRKF